MTVKLSYALIAVSFMMPVVFDAQAKKRRLTLQEIEEECHGLFYLVDPIFPGRWSSRRFSDEAVGKEELMVLFEAARWAPSKGNNQPWRYVYAMRDTKHWDTFTSFLKPFNAWAKDASVLVAVTSKNTLGKTGEPNGTHSFDAGASWENFALQGTMRGLVVHAMDGFDRDKARNELGVPKDFDIEAMIAIGHPSRVRQLEKVSDRKPLEEIVAEGRFTFSK